MSKPSELINVTVRISKKEDMVKIHKLIKALAEFEKLEDQVKITAETLEKDGFSENPVFTCLVAELSDGSIVGYALYYSCYSTWVGKSIFLEDLYVTPEYRGCKIGKNLLLAVAKIAKEIGGRLDWHVLSWNPAIEFYKTLGAIDLTRSEKWHLFRLNKDALDKLFDK